VVKLRYSKNIYGRIYNLWPRTLGGNHEKRLSALPKCYWGARILHVSLFTVIILKKKIESFKREQNQILQKSEIVTHPAACTLQVASWWINDKNVTKIRNPKSEK
jgi:hypothetical protein